jgi:hypothetical protein
LRDPRIDFERIVRCAENVIEYAGALTFDVSGQPHRITPLLLLTKA